MLSNSSERIQKIKYLFLPIPKEIPKQSIKYYSEMDSRPDFLTEIWLKEKDNLPSTHSKLEKHKYLLQQMSLRDD
jgi:hypothetical protein